VTVSATLAVLFGIRKSGVEHVESLTHVVEGETELPCLILIERGRVYLTKEGIVVLKHLAEAANSLLEGRKRRTATSFSSFELRPLLGGLPFDLAGGPTVLVRTLKQALLILKRETKDSGEVGSGELYQATYAVLDASLVAQTVIESVDAERARELTLTEREFSFALQERAKVGIALSALDKRIDRTVVDVVDDDLSDGHEQVKSRGRVEFIQFVDDGVEFVVGQSSDVIWGALNFCWGLVCHDFLPCSQRTLPLKEHSFKNVMAIRHSFGDETIRRSWTGSTPVVSNGGTTRRLDSLVAHILGPYRARALVFDGASGDSTVETLCAASSARTTCGVFLVGAVGAPSAFGLGT
jgi:hypothetical protein